MTDQCERHCPSIDEIEWVGSGDLTTADVLAAIKSGPLLHPQSGDVGLMLDKQDGTRALGVAYDSMVSFDVEALSASGVLRGEHLFTAAALDFLRDNPSVGFSASIECFYDNEEGWWGIVRRVALAKDVKADPSSLAAFIKAFSQEPGGASFVQGPTIMLFNEKGAHYVETFDYRAQTLTDLPNAHSMPFTDSDNS